MRELLFCENSEKSEKGENLTCEYRVIVGETGGHFACESYGVKVTLRQTGETVEIPDITVSAARIESLISLLCRNMVTPCTLGEIVADWL